MTETNRQLLLYMAQKLARARATWDQVSTFVRQYWQFHLRGTLETFGNYSDVSNDVSNVSNVLDMSAAWCYRHTPVLEVRCLQFDGKLKTGVVL